MCFIFNLFKTYFMSKAITISAAKRAKLTKLAKAMPRLTKIAGLMDRAQEEGNLGPEEVKDIAADTKEILLQVVEMVEDIEQGVPVEDSPIEEEEVIEEDNDLPIVEGQEDNDDEKKKEDPKIAQLRKELNDIKYASKILELKTKYGKLFDEALREAKEKDFVADNPSIVIAEERIKQASKILSDKKVMRVAMIETDGSTSYIEDEDSNELNFKGVI